MEIHLMRENSRQRGQKETKSPSHINPGDSLRELVIGKKEVRRVQRSIAYRLSPIFGIMQHVKRDYLPLLDLLMRQADVVGHMGMSVAQMAEVCKGDQSNLFQYIHKLHGRIHDYTARSSTLEAELASRLEQSRTGKGKTVEELEDAIKTLELRYDCRNIGLNIGDAQRYSGETEKLLESTTQMYKDLEGIAQRFCGVGVHLNMVSLVLAHKIEIGSKSRALQDIFRNIRQNNDRTAVEVDHGVQYVQSLLTGASLPCTSSSSGGEMALTPELYLQQSIKREESRDAG